MTPDQIAVAVGVEAALVAVALGLVVRGRWRASWFFAAYVPIALTGNILVTWWPAAFYSAGFWMAKQVVYDGLKLGLALELAWRTFHLFPGARAAAERAALLTLALTTIAIIFVPTQTQRVDSVYLTAIGEFHPRALIGTIWLMVATLGLAQLYHVPLHAFHAALLTSFGAYLMVFTLLLRLEGIYGWVAQPYVNALDPPAYLLLACFWVYAAWRPQTQADMAYEDTLHRLGLSRASCG